MTRAILRRFSVGPIPFLRRPVSEPPPDGTICFVDNGDDHGFTKRTYAEFKDGVWSRGNRKPLPFEPTHWIVLDDGARA